MATHKFDFKDGNGPVDLTVHVPSGQSLLELEGDRSTFEYGVRLPSLETGPIAEAHRVVLIERLKDSCSRVSGTLVVSMTSDTVAIFYADEDLAEARENGWDEATQIMETVFPADPPVASGKE